MTKQQPQKKRTAKTAAGGALLALFLLFGWCGRGLFFGDGKPGDESAEHIAKESAETAADTQANDAGMAPRCAIRVDAVGVQLGGEAAEVSAILVACKARGEADLTVTGDAKFGTADELRAALSAAGIRVFEAKASAPPAAAPAPPAPETPPPAAE
tara:strand:- start:87540 stop:88007 length:468 start_codon:yes stop_codon:yes gene_type:complete